MTLNKSETMCQPCDNYEKPDWEYMATGHWCPDCNGVRYFCKNCSLDHHVGGWQTCPCGGKRATCLHPACIAAEQQIKGGRESRNAIQDQKTLA